MIRVPFKNIAKYYSAIDSAVYDGVANLAKEDEDFIFDAWLKKYDAYESVEGNRLYWIFTNEAKYMEFCLRWIG